MTDALLTILVVYFDGYSIQAPYTTRTGCGEALLVVAESDLPSIYARCWDRYAPSISLLPIARPQPD